MEAWPDSPTHRRWLDHETLSLLEFGREVAHPDGGAAWLDSEGRPRLDQPVHLWISARMVHVYAIGSLLGVPGCRPRAEAVLTGLTGRLRDTEHGGWHSALAPDGQPVLGPKSCYDHAFALLAGATATVAGLDEGPELLDDARAVFVDRFWDEEAGMVVDTWDQEWTSVDGYRGINSSMHSVEAMLATADATGDPVWAERAGRVAARVAGFAETHDWRLPEHFDARWTPLLEFNADRPADPFKPYGATVGHGLEWARLLLQVDATLGADAPAGLPEAAVRLFDRAVTDGWHVDGEPGFVYTTDWDGHPVTRQRMHWVAAEGIGAAAALWRRTGDAAYAAWYRSCWDYADTYLRDREHGSWTHELDAGNRPASGTWEGKPDLYHAVQATLLPRLPITPSIATAVAAGMLAP